MQPLGMLKLTYRRDCKLEGPFCPGADWSSGERVDENTIRGSTVPGSKTSVKVESYIGERAVGDVELGVGGNIRAQRQRHMICRLFVTSVECE